LEAYLADGVIRLESSQIERGRIRTIVVEKMRGTVIDDQVRPYVIQQGGIKVFSEKDLFSFAASLFTKETSR
jgi:KaiC/GvpD/RAD55 family RecA-like ATPase